MTGILASKVLSLLAFILEEHNLDAVVVHGARGQVVMGSTAERRSRPDSLTRRGAVMAVVMTPPRTIHPVPRHGHGGSLSQRRMSPASIWTRMILITDQGQSFMTRTGRPVPTTRKEWLARKAVGR